MTEAASLIRAPLTAPLAVAGGAVAATAVAATFKPGEFALFPPCPLYVLTGIYCPGCGATRSLHDLTHFDIAGALQNNLLLVVLLPVMAYAWLAWFSERRGGKRLPQLRIGAKTAWAIVAILGAYTIARNIGAGPLALLVPIPV